MTDRPYQMLPPLDEEQRHLLRQSIEKNGVLEPVVFDEDGEILDGHHRVEIAEELDIEYPRRVVTDLDEEGKRRYAITTNVARRQLNPSVRSGLVAQLRMQGLSIREIAKETGLPKSTVSDDLRQVSGSGHLPATVTGSDGKKYASTRPTSAPGPTDAADSPPADPGASPALAVESPAPAAPQEPDLIPEHDAASAWKGDEPGSCGVACLCGVELDGFDTLDEAAEELARHIETPESASEGAAPLAGSGLDDSAPNGAPRPADPTLDAQLAQDSTRRAAIRNLTSVLTYLNPLAIAPAELAKREYGPVLDEFKQDDLDRAVETLTTIAALKRGM